MTKLSEWAERLGIITPPAVKAAPFNIYSGNGTGTYGTTSYWSNDPQARAAAYLKAYKVGWFYKAESRISTDMANLKRTLAPEDSLGDNETDILEADLMTPWEQLDPAHQFLRLMERPNPKQSGRQLFQKTQIRLDMAGWTLWYLDGAGPEHSGVLPNAIYGISPSRMTPSFDNTGNLIGWVMDRDRSGGVPFQTYEIVQFASETAEDSVYGQGVVEAVMSELPLGNSYARHQEDLLSTGGRLAGMLWPKARTLDEDEFVDAQRAWRNVASDPNAARRMLLFPEPMEYANGAADPEKIGIPELSMLNRDNILTAFPISPYMLGVPMPGGLNSGEVRREERRDYWEGTIHPRVELLEEVIQTNIIARYEQVAGVTYDFDIEEPNLENAGSLIEKVAAFEALTLAGFDEQDAIQTLGLDIMGWTKPAPPPPPVITTVGTAEAPGNNSSVSEAVPTAPVKPAPVKSVESDRDHVTDIASRNARDRLAAFFTEQRKRTAQNLQKNLPQTKAERMKAQPDWWDSDYEDEELRATMRAIYADVGRGALQTVSDAVDRIIYKGATQAVIADLFTFGGERIKDINARTLQAITIELAEGTRRGYSIPQLIEGVPDEGYKGVNGAGMDNGVEVWSELRAETIARTETMLSYNRATVTGYGEFGVTHLLAYDGDGDEECAARDGVEFTIDEAQDIADHPNGTLVWSPVVDKSVDKPDPGYELALKAIEAFMAQRPETPVNNVHVYTPEVTPHITVEAQEPMVMPSIFVDAPDLGPIADAIKAAVPVTNVFVEPSKAPEVTFSPVVTVEPSAAPQVTFAPIVNVEPSKAPEVTFSPVVTVEAPPATVINLPEPVVNVNIPPPTKVTKTVIRDKNGRITGVKED